MIENNLKFTPATITFSEIRELAVSVNAFFRSSKIIEKIQEGNFNPISDMPEMILKDEDTMKAFLNVVEYCTGLEIDDTEGIKTLNLIHEVLDFLNEVNVTAFLSKMAMTVANMIKG